MFQFSRSLASLYPFSGSGEANGSNKDSKFKSLESGLDHSTESKESRRVTVKQFLQHVRNLSGLKKEDVFCDLRVPGSFQTSRQEISLILCTGAGVYCIDIKWWTGEVSAQACNNWHIQEKHEVQDSSTTFIQQVADPLKAVTMKANDLYSHMQRCGVNIKKALFIPRILFLSPHCHLNEELRKRKELISHENVESFLHSIKESYVTWITDAFTPAWISGHLSFWQLAAVREKLGKMGTWDILQLNSGDLIKGDFLGCQHLALNRQETDVLEFSNGWGLPTEKLWTLLGHTPQITVRMYKRGAQSWLGKPLSGTTTIPSNTHIVFRLSNEDKDAKIPANAIHTIMLSI